MRLEHYPIEKLKKEILIILGSHLDLRQYRVFFFGSRVQGKGNYSSDIDVGIEGVTPVPFVVLEDIKEELDRLSTLYKIDVMDFAHASKKFREVAFQNIEPLTLLHDKI